MPGNRKFTRIPPESTGDRIRVKSSTDIYYDNKTGTLLRETEFTLATSGLKGQISRVRADTLTTGMISVNYNEISEDADSTSPVTGEAIQINGSTVALVAPTAPIDTYANITTLVSYDNQYYGQRVNENGEAFVRFGEGSPRVDASGKLEVGETTVIARYNFTYDIMPDEFGAITTGAASVVHSVPENCGLITATTGATDRAIFRSHLYHHYTPGIPIIYEGTTTHSDTGKANQVRRWGMFDEADGLFFELDGTALSFVRRTSTSGAPVETKIIQANWNKDTLDGSGNRRRNPSNVSLDVSKINSYWIDYTWHGAGIVRFGVNADGHRLLCHVESFANIDTLAFMSRGSLPVTWEIENTGVTASTSELRSWSAGVYSSALMNLIKENKTYTHFLGTPAELTGPTETHAISFRPKDTINGVDNHTVTSFIKIEALAYDSVVGGDAAIAIMRLYRGGTFGGGGASWVDASLNSSLQRDTSGNYNLDGVQIAEYYIQGTEYIDLEAITGYWYRSILKLADGTLPEYHFTVQRLIGANNINFTAQFRWKEIRG